MHASPSEGGELLALQSGSERAVPAARFLLVEYRPAPLPLSSPGDAAAAAAAGSVGTGRGTVEEAAAADDGGKLLAHIEAQGYRGFLMLSGRAGAAAAAAATAAVGSDDDGGGGGGGSAAGWGWSGWITEHVQPLSELARTARQLMAEEGLEHTEVLFMRRWRR
jgi:hypothetical protein